MSKMGPSTPAEYGAVARQALWRFAAQTRLTGAVRDQAAVAMVRSRFPKTRGVFTDAQLAAVLREPGGRCSWDALRDVDRGRRRTDAHGGQGRTDGLAWQPLQPLQDHVRGAEGSPAGACSACCCQPIHPGPYGRPVAGRAGTDRRRRGSPGSRPQGGAAELLPAEEQPVTVTRHRLPWSHHIGTGCRCDAQAPCLLHFHGLDWRGRNQAFSRAGVQPSNGR